MLELAAYILGEEYEALEGQGGPYSDLTLGPDADAWMLVGPEPKIANVRMPRELAFAELEDRGRLQPGSVLFRLSGDRAKEDCWGDSGFGGEPEVWTVPIEFPGA